MCKSINSCNAKKGVMVYEVTQIKEKDVDVGRLLGCGSFCTVQEIEAIRGLNESNCESHASISKQLGEYGLVLKKLRNIEKEEARKKAIKGIEQEIILLSQLDHPNIIKIRASSEFPFSANSFLVVDRLQTCLNDEILSWQRKDLNLSKIPGMLLYFRGKKKKEILTQKLLVLYDLASAIEYLHKLNIIHRDIKPENIGFDINGELKLFDFGLARKLPPGKRIGNDKFSLTGATGTLRYMAPECVNYLPYGLSVDIFSFSIVMWEIMECALPFENFSVEKYRDLVVENGHRLPLDESWPRQLSKLILKCWSHFPSKRAKIAEVKASLRKIMEDQGMRHCVDLRNEQICAEKSIDNLESTMNSTLIIAGAA